MRGNVNEITLKNKSFQRFRNQFSLVLSLHFFAPPFSSSNEMRVYLQDLKTQLQRVADIVAATESVIKLMDLTQEEQEVVMEDAGMEKNPVECSTAC